LVAIPDIILLIAIPDIIFCANFGDGRLRGLD